MIEAFHILNQFDIPKGSAREHEKDEHGNVVADYTLWTSAIDLKAKQYFFRTYNNSAIRMIDLMKMDFDAKEYGSDPIKGEEVIQPIVSSRSNSLPNVAIRGTTSGVKLQPS